jgi:hypothetical protein
MPIVLIATNSGCRVFTEAGKETRELAGRKIGPYGEKPATFILLVYENPPYRPGIALREMQ